MWCLFMKVLAFTKEKAAKHMLRCSKGKSIVATERVKGRSFTTTDQAHGFDGERLAGNEMRAGRKNNELILEFGDRKELLLDTVQAILQNTR